MTETGSMRTGRLVLDEKWVFFVEALFLAMSISFRFTIFEDWLLFGPHMVEICTYNKPYAMTSGQSDRISRLSVGDYPHKI
jgi:hypothetical protein